MHVFSVTHGARSGRSGQGQYGQALVESLVAMLGLVALWAALHWLAHYQDIGLSTVHASRHAAFSATRIGEEDVGHAVLGGFFSGKAHRWTDLRSQAVLDTQTPVQVSWQRTSPLSTQAQPGTGLAQARVLRRDWSLEDGGILRARVVPGFASGRAGLAYPPLRRSTSILAGAAHAASDTVVQSRVAASDLAWAAAHSVSQLAGMQVKPGAGGVDDAWGRADPEFDWLQPWSGRIPGYLVVDYTQADQGGN